MKVLRNFSFKSPRLFLPNILLMSFLFFFTFFYFTISTYSQTICGKASYYSSNLQGKRTASGEIYCKMKYTAAHKSYPFGTKLKITHTTNGKSTVVTVNDRGPYSNSRIIDLSYAAAKELDLLTCGIGEVTIEVLNNTETLQYTDIDTVDILKEGYYLKNSKIPVSLTGILLQTGCFKTLEDALIQISAFEKVYIGVPFIHISRIKEDIVYEVVYSGFYTNQAAIERYCTLLDKGIESLIIEIE